MISRDPFFFLNPTVNVLELIQEPLIHNRIFPSDEAYELFFDILEEVGLEKHTPIDTFKHLEEDNGRGQVLHDHLY